MRPWKYSIDIKQFIGDGDDRDSVKAAAMGISREVRLKIGQAFAEDYEFEVLADELDAIIEDDDADCDDFNSWLSNFYDFADAKRIWCGL